MYEDLSATDEHILTVLNYYVTQGSYVSITTLADTCNVAKSTVVKLAQKLGYAGFSDLRGDLASGRRDTVSESYLPSSITGDDDALEMAAHMAQRFWACRNDRNVLIARPESGGFLLSSYLERKLAMLDVTALCTYDYATIMSTRASAGIALFYEHNVAPRAEKGHVSIVVSKPHFRLAQEMGYRILLVSDAPAAPAVAAGCDVFRVKPSRDPRVDLFMPRVIMLFELMLSELARIGAMNQPSQAHKPSVELIGTARPLAEEDDEL